MGAGASIGISGVGTAADTGGDWWRNAAAVAGLTYTFNWGLIADAATAGGPLAPAAKFTAGPPVAGYAWPANVNAVSGLLGSYASSMESGGSSFNKLGFPEVDTNVSAVAAAAGAAGARAHALSVVLDEWEVSILQVGRLTNYLMATVTPQLRLAPSSTGRSTFKLFGSFGEIAIRLEGGSNAPSCDVRLEAGWQIHVDLPGLSMPLMPRPTNAIDADGLKRLVLDQHDPAVPRWTWRRPPPALTLVKEVASGVGRASLQINVSAEDEDKTPGGEQQQQRQRSDA